MFNLPKHGPIAAVLAMSIFGFSSLAHAQENNPIKDYPHALICVKGDTTVIGYLAKVGSDGSALYMTPNDIFVAVSSEGRVDNRAEGSCSNKTIAELRANGQTREFAK